MALSMTCGVIMFYYAQHTRQVTDFAGIKGPSKIGRRGHLAAARAVNTCSRVAAIGVSDSRLVQHFMAAAVVLLSLNDKSATMVNRDDDKPNCKPGFQVCDIFVIRSIRNYHKLAARFVEDRAGFNVASSDATRLLGVRGGFCQRGIPFHVYIPL